MSALENITVLDLSRYLPGPYCTLMLADYGAEVIKVEQPHEVVKKRKTFGQGGLPDDELERLKKYEIASRNKRSLLLDMRSPSSARIMRGLIEKADVLVSDYRPGVLDEAGYGYEQVRQINPRLIYCAISLCGQDGPYRDVPGHDPVSLAVAGVLTRFNSDDAPCTIGIPISDINCALHATVGVLMALRAREKTGEGQLVDVAMSDTAFAFVTPSLGRLLSSGEEPPIGINMANNGVWETSDGRYICTTDMEPRYWNSFCDLIERPQWKPLIHKRSQYEDELRQIFLTRPRDEWIGLFRQAGTQGAPVLSLTETIDDPHARARGVMIDVEEDGDRVTHVGPLIKMSATPGEIRHLARMPGRDSRDILGELGYSPAEIEALIEEIGSSGDPALARYLG